MPDDPGAVGARSIARGMRIGVVGAGRLGSSLAIALVDSGYTVSAVSTRDRQRGEWLESRLPNSSVFTDPGQVAESSDLVFLTVSDSAIQQVAELVEWQSRHFVVHCSGAVSLDALGSATRAGASVGGFHPLQTFPTPGSADLLHNITFGIEAQDLQLEKLLASLALEFGGDVHLLKPGERPAYHAAAVMACGLLAGLTGLAAEVWAHAGSVSRDQAVRALTPLVKTTANSVGENGLPLALTGPYVRGDVETVGKHLEAAASTSDQHAAAYASLALATLHIAKEQGRLTSEAEASIKSMLINSLVESCEKIEEA